MGDQARGTGRYQTFTEAVMGTVVVITVATRRDDLDRPTRLALAEARARLHRADAIFSVWRPGSPLSRLRRDEIQIEACPPEVAEIVALSHELRNLTDGWFDPWSMPGGFDPTGLVKGWAGARAAEAFELGPISGVIVNAAGDVATLGSIADGMPFRIGIVDPTRRTELAAVVDSPGAVATSGTYERGAHLLDPHLGRPCARVASATVTGPSLAHADALATAVAVAGVDTLSIVERLPAYEALTIGYDGRLRATAGFPFVSASPVRSVS